jgi:mRNA-degrading endonuclease RelE of RelBE toxin-antitoxin system
MSYSIELTRNFEREFKRLYKKYASLKGDLAQLGAQLSSNPRLGTSLGHDCFKIRLAISSKGKGKSGGARLITHVYVSGK